MTKFHDFDPLALLLECQKTAQVAYNNTQQLAQAHNQSDRLLTELLQQHNNIVDLLMRTRREIEKLQKEITQLREKNGQ